MPNTRWRAALDLNLVLEIPNVSRDLNSPANRSSSSHFIRSRVWTIVRKPSMTASMPSDTTTTSAAVHNIAHRAAAATVANGCPIIPGKNFPYCTRHSFNNLLKLTIFMLPNPRGPRPVGAQTVETPTLGATKKHFVPYPPSIKISIPSSPMTIILRSRASNPRPSMPGSVSKATSNWARHLLDR